MHSTSQPQQQPQRLRREGGGGGGGEGEVTTIMYKRIAFNSYSCLSFVVLLLLVTCCSHPSSGCSSRTVPKPRPPTSSIVSSSMSGTVLPPTQVSTPTTTTRMTTTTMRTTTTPRPNITFPTYKCPETFDAWYCLNDAHCFAVKIGELPVYSCECAVGFMGQRCEYKEIDGSYLPKRPRPMLEKASIASGAMCALVFMLIICLALYLRCEQRAAKKAFELMEQEEEQQQQQQQQQQKQYHPDEDYSACEQCDCCRSQCAYSTPLENEKILPYHMRLEHALISLALRRNIKL